MTLFFLCFENLPKKKGANFKLKKQQHFDFYRNKSLTLTIRQTPFLNFLPFQDRDDVDVVYEEKRKRSDIDHEDSRPSSKSSQNGDADRKMRGSSASSSRRNDSKRK